MPRFPLALVAVAVLAAGCSADAKAQLTPVTPSPTAIVETTPPVIWPTAVPTTVSPTPKPKPKPPSYDVKAVQTRLTELRYYVGAIDGTPGGPRRSSLIYT